MNFDYMPELKWHYAYICLGVMLVITIVLVIFSKGKMVLKLLTKYLNLNKGRYFNE